MPDLLENLVDFERNEIVSIQSNIHQLVIEYYEPTSLPLTNRNVLNVNIILVLGGHRIHAKMNKVFIHQIGKRIYGDNYGNEYLPLFHNWLNDYNINNSIFKEKIRSAIVDNKLIIRFFLNNNEARFYGFVSEKFENTDQIGFRKSFHDCANATGKINTNSLKQYRQGNNITGAVKEYYEFETDNSIISLNCGIVYGLNNGYGAYSTHWIRKFKSNDVWLTPWKSELEFKWRNNPKFHDDTARIEMDRFVSFIIDEGTKHRIFIEDKVSKAQNEPLDYKKIKDFYELLRVARATEDRIDDILQNKVIEKGNTLLSYVESICYVGTFAKYTAKSVKNLLIQMGTRLLVDEGFDIILKSNKEIKLTGDYDWF